MRFICCFWFCYCCFVVVIVIVVFIIILRYDLFTSLSNLSKTHVTLIFEKHTTVAHGPIIEICPRYK